MQFGQPIHYLGLGLLAFYLYTTFGGGGGTGARVHEISFQEFKTKLLAQVGRELHHEEDLLFPPSLIAHERALVFSSPPQSPMRGLGCSPLPSSIAHEGAPLVFSSPSQSPLVPAGSGD